MNQPINDQFISFNNSSRNYLNHDVIIYVMNARNHKIGISKSIDELID